ncbi:hypothetical protein B0H14DRAFT_317244 [Mycena olivaceomarginata]|nr:hypothetical protein B0H14DRAFT_317244 [Mycena olivaceomarginata]
MPPPPLYAFRSRRSLRCPRCRARATVSVTAHSRMNPSLLSHARRHPHLPSLGSSQYPPAKRGAKISSLWQMPVLERTSSSIPREQDPQRWWPLPHPRSVPTMLFSVFSPKKKKTLAHILPFPKKTQVSSLFSIPTQPRRDNASYGALWNGYDTTGCM